MKKFSNLLNKLRDFNDIFKKDVTYDNMKSRKKNKASFFLFLKNTFLEKLQDTSHLINKGYFSFNIMLQFFIPNLIVSCIKDNLLLSYSKDISTVIN